MPAVGHSCGSDGYSGGTSPHCWHSPRIERSPSHCGTVWSRIVGDPHRPTTKSNWLKHIVTHATRSYSIRIPDGENSMNEHWHGGRFGKPAEPRPYPVCDAYRCRTFGSPHATAICWAAVSRQHPARNGRSATLSGITPTWSMSISVTSEPHFVHGLVHSLIPHLLSGDFIPPPGMRRARVPIGAVVKPVF